MFDAAIQNSSLTIFDNSGKKIEELKKGDTGNELKFSRNETNFLGFDYKYFRNSYKTSKKIITELKTYCETKFIQQDSN